MKLSMAERAEKGLRNDRGELERMEIAFLSSAARKRE
jgi:hypothetical protein